MPNPIPIRQQLDQELDRLSPESLTQILAFARSLQPQRSSEKYYTKLWVDWFAQVDTLPLDPQVPPELPDYANSLAEKYRAQGLNL
ncbi:MAG: hypothetical protein ACPGVO_05355 [Spirulinaceae cyanobacterium]